jgi:ABC-type taurine transport system substrate-binding protein
MLVLQLILLVALHQAVEANTCVAKNATAWLALGCTVDNPTATTVPELGTILPGTTEFTKCTITCPIDDAPFHVVAVQSPWRLNSIGPPKIACTTVADCAATPYYSACENQACVLHVRISTFGAFDPNEVASAIGAFDDGPYRYRQYTASSGMSAIDKLLNGEVDITTMGSPPAASAVGRSGELKYIGLQDLIMGDDALVAKPGINNAQDLVGKKIGIPCGSTSHYMVVFFLQQTAVVDVEIVCDNPAELKAMWDADEIDAIAIWGHWKIHALSSGGKKIMDPSVASMWGKDIFSIWAVRNDFLAKHPEAVKNFVRVQLAGE